MRFYTLAEANAMLPDLTRLLEEMRVQGQQMAAVEGRKARVRQKIRGNGYHNPIEDATVEGLSEGLRDELQESLTQLQDWGIELKDLEVGLVDFPALHEGRTVFLCWQLGESQVEYWHETTTGFAGRQPIDDTFS